MNARLPIVLALLGIAPGALAQSSDSHFQEITLKRHLGLEAQDDTRALVLGDLDGDGALDLFAGNFHNPNRYYRNDGLGRFTDILVSHGPGVESTLAATMGDVDRDGDLDLILVITDQARLLLNDGTAGLTDVTASHMPQDRAETRAVLLGDVDRDGDLDLLLARGGRTAAQNRLYLNDGSGAFADATQVRLPALADFTSSLALGDLDRDGDLDLVLGNGSRYAPREQNRIYTNDGSGTFTDATALLMPPTQLQTQALALGDVDRDGDLDLLTGNWGQSRLYLNDGSGRLVDGTSLRLPSNADITNAVALGDLDGDADLDLVLGNSGPDRVYLNNGFGGYTPSSAPLPSDTGTTQAITLGDLDDDGDADIVLGVRGSNRLFLNDGSASFADATPLRMPPHPSETRAVLLSDVDGDNALDILLANEGQALGKAQNRLYLNDGTGRFADATSAGLPVDEDNTQAVASGDVDGDGDLDLILANGGQTFAPSRQNRIYINDGLGRFLDLTTTRLPVDSDHSSAVATGDVDGDGDLDLVLGNEGNFFSGQPNRLYLNDGSGFFRDGPGLPGDVDVTQAVALGDVDGDGDLDLVVGNLGEDRLYVNDGSGAFSAQPTALPANDGRTNDLDLGDVDGDGDLDLVVGNFGQNRLYTNDGSGQFTDNALPLVWDNTSVVNLADMNRDGHLDLVVGNYVNSPHGSLIQIYINDGQGNFGQTTETQIDIVLALSDLGLATGDVDGDGDVDLVTGTLIRNGVAATRLFTNLQIQITTPFLPILSRDFELEFHARKPNPQGTHGVLPAASLALAATPLAVHPFGLFYLEQGGVIPLPRLSIPPHSGVGSLVVRIPNDPSLVGRTLYSQALIVNFSDPMGDSHLTGYTADVIGR